MRSGTERSERGSRSSRSLAGPAARYALGNVELPVGQLTTLLRERKLNQGGTLVASERIRLRGPVHGAQRGGEALEVVLRPLVVGDDDLFAGHSRDQPYSRLRRTNHPCQTTARTGGASSAAFEELEDGRTAPPPGDSW